jgi:hypothetical protein
MLTNRMTQLFSALANPVSLTYRDGIPTFKQGENYGTSYSLSFGQENSYGDAFRGLVEFNYRITTLRPGMYVLEGASPMEMPYQDHLGDDVYRFLGQAPKVSELNNKILHALQDHVEFDFTEYQTFWTLFDEDFYMDVYTNPNAESITEDQEQKVAENSAGLEKKNDVSIANILIMLVILGCTAYVIPIFYPAFWTYFNRFIPTPLFGVFIILLVVAAAWGIYKIKNH